MNESRRRLVDELYAVSHAHDQAQEDRLERFRNVEPPTAELLGVLIRATGARRDPRARHVQRLLHDLAGRRGAGHRGDAWSASTSTPRRTELARENLRRAGLEERVELRTEDAAQTLAGSEDAEWEFVFLDAERPAYPGYLRDLVRTLAPGGLLAVDNVELARARAGRVHGADRGRAGADADGRAGRRRAEARCADG